MMTAVTVANSRDRHPYRLPINCDLGEGLETVDQQAMPFLLQANVACGGHAGDEVSMKWVTRLAIEQGVAIHAHPSYPDRAHFGRKSMTISLQELAESLWTQVQNLQRIVATFGGNVTAIKPHGALYHDMMQHPSVLQVLLETAARLGDTTALVVQAVPGCNPCEALAQPMGIRLIMEGFGDRAYQDDGSLAPRHQPGSVHDRLDSIVSQVRLLNEQGKVFTRSGKVLDLQVDTICLHGDHPLVLQALQQLKKDGAEAN
jgi:5-oxoprolinase (ATP-hydrolysing) subunit A